jgi:hypothetical protein
MKALAAKTPLNDTSTKSAGVKHRHTPGPKSVPVFAGTNTFIQTKSICPCDGGCPRCQGVIQPKLNIGQPHDKYEQEADRVADQIMRMPEPGGSSVQRKTGCLGCMEEEEGPVQLKSSTDKSPLVTDGLQSQIQSLKGGGQPLPESTRAFFEPRFGRDFSQVRVHTDTKAAGAAKSINSKAFTTGKDIVFGAGQYSTGTPAGKRLLGHELTHVVQQNKFDRTPDIQRLVGYHSICPPGVNGTPNNSYEQLKEHDRDAAYFSFIASSMTYYEADITAKGGRGLARCAFERRFGLPPKNHQGYYVNRLNDQPHRTLEGALSEELRFLAWRLGTIGQLFAQINIIYHCIDKGGSYFHTTVPDCGIGWAMTSRNIIWICPRYWRDKQFVRPIFLIHEGAHFFGIGDNPPGNTPAANFFVADCYARYVADLWGILHRVPRGVCPCNPSPNCSSLLCNIYGE